MSVLDDIMKKNTVSRPVTSQSVATHYTPSTGEEVSQPSTAAQSGQNDSSIQSAVQGVQARRMGGASRFVSQPSTAAAAQPAQTGFTAPKKVTPAQAQTAPAAQPAPAPATEQQKQMSMVDLLNAFYTPETPEQKAKRERKEKWDKTAAAIGDGISALANLYYTTKGAPNSYDGKNSMSERTRQLYEKLDKDRKENERWYLNYYMNAAKMDEESARDARNWQNTLDQQAYQKEKDEKDRAERKAKMDTEQDRWQKEFEATQSFRQQQLEQSDKQFTQKMGQDNAQFWATFNRQDPATQQEDLAEIAQIFATLPEEVRTALSQEPVYDKITGTQVIGYKPKSPTANDMLIAIGQNLGNAATKAAWDKFQNRKKGKKAGRNTQNGSGGGTHSHRVGDNNQTTDV